MLRADDEGLVELAQQLRLGRPLDRIVAHDASRGVHRHTVAALHEQRNPLVVVHHIVEGGRCGDVAEPEQVAAVGGEHRRIDDRLPERRDLLQIDIAGLRADDAARNFHFRRLAAAHGGSRSAQDDKRFSAHEWSFSHLTNTKIIQSAGSAKNLFAPAKGTKGSAHAGRKLRSAPGHRAPDGNSAPPPRIPAGAADHFDGLRCAEPFLGKLRPCCCWRFCCCRRCW